MEPYHECILRAGRDVTVGMGVTTGHDGLDDGPESWPNWAPDSIV